MRYIFLSPHLDDIALSCGGIVNHLFSNKISVEIWTIFSGSPEASDLSPFALSLHKRWKLPFDAPKRRRLEDIKACNILGANYKHFDFLDCIYRHDSFGIPVIQQEEDLYQSLPQSQNKLIKEISDLIESHVLQDDIIVSPLAIGNHVDHQIITKAISNLEIKNLNYYEEYPYVIKAGNINTNFSNLSPISFTLDEENISNWYQSIAAYESQISTFWKNLEYMKSEIKDFYFKGGGKNLWKTLVGHINE